jgi:hypothetical protein
MQKLIVKVWNYTFDHEVSPLRHIPDIAVRHMILQILAAMWTVAFSTAIGSYTYFGAYIIGHMVLIGAATITVATYTVAANKPSVFQGLGRSKDGEHG